MTLRVEFVTDLGARVSLEVQNENELLEVQRRYGRLGWYSGDVPPGGFQFPLDNEPDFDWALLGGRKFKNDEGEDCVWCRGAVYKRRELAAVDTKKLRLPAAVKYSRGARPGDPDYLREKSDGEIEYVTLAIFRGGRRNEAYATRTARPESLPAGNSGAAARRPTPSRY
ncbi:hypothetical protein HNR42_002586 [Deinobacterium chartae]|uniref:Uncharacterized protein n=1 Tax=Deinobacterium chartae TaxID=521158 RepID=A0A841I409_9DEIO|nr:single-stranded DNA-binding protein [Deinobacterium chartae]MBB6099150.1 hypothetical protein [Deinobacterium chartae]